MKIINIALTLIAATCIGTVQAGQNETIDFANVINAEPIYANVARVTPERQCWIEQVRYEIPQRHHRSKTPNIVGALIGAAIGHNVAKSKSGQRAGRVAGAILGTSIASDIAQENANRSVAVEYRDEERCEIREHTRYEQVIVGYDVTYQYHGNTYRARLNDDPGERLRVAINVRPVL